MRSIHPFRNAGFPSRFLLVILCMLALPWPAASQSKVPRRKTAEAQWSRQGRAPGVELRISSKEPRQGSLQVVEVRSARRLAEISGKWDGNAVEFWAAGGVAEKESDVRRGL